jgi:hypothetical protein
MKIIISILTGVLFSMLLKAQDSALIAFANKYEQEKIYVHFDKLVYNKGESIWFKAYLTSNNLPTTISKNFYADWYDASGNLIVHQSYPIISSCSNGQLEIPENYNGQKVHLKAYTTWMLNFDTTYLFHKDILVYSPITQKQGNVDSTIVLDFFPEGGNMVNGLPSFIAFKATNKRGLPIAIKGVVKDDKNELIDSIKTDYDGMGLLYIANVEAKKTYTAYWQKWSGSATYTSVLPQALDNGIALQVEKFGSAIKVKIERTDAVPDDLKHVRVYCFKGSENVYAARVKLTQKTNKEVDIDLKNVGSGIIQVSIFSDSYVPIAERIVFINNKDFAFAASLENKNIKKIEEQKMKLISM